MLLCSQGVEKICSLIYYKKFIYIIKLGFTLCDHAVLRLLFVMLYSSILKRYWLIIEHGEDNNSDLNIMF